MSDRTFLHLQVAAYIFLASLIALPHIIHVTHPDYQGLIMMRSTDDGFYFARIKAGLLQRFSEMGNGMTGGNPPALGASPALLETVAGTLFSWTNLHAPEVATLLNIFLTPLTFLLFSLLLRELGTSYRWSLWGAAILIFILLSPLQKPVQISLSFPTILLALLLLLRAWKHSKSITSVLAAVVIAALTQVYFWGWTFVWAVFGVLFLLQLFAGTSSMEVRRLKRLLITGVLTFIFATPTFLQMIALGKMQPVFTETALRSTLVHTRSVESLPRSLLLLLLASLATVLFLREKKLRTEMMFPLSIVLGITLAMHQNLVHGMLLSFVSHYYAYVCLASLIIGLFAFVRAPRSPLSLAVTAVAAIFLLAALYDYRTLMPKILLARQYYPDLEHLAPALRTLDDGKRETVLTDWISSHMVTSWTDDDVIFTNYTRHSLVTDQEYAERYCATEIFNPGGPDYHWLAMEVVEGWGEADVAKREREMQKRCAVILRDPRIVVRTYDVTWLLWNERRRPRWRIDTHLFTNMHQGNGWSLWRVRSP